jgi:ketosteroid isomerase-like protein
MLFLMRIFTILFFVAAALAVAADKSVDAVKAAEKSWATATVAGDEATLRKILADDLTYTHSTGEINTKDEYIDNLKTGARKYLKADHESMDVRLYGNTAVLRATAQVETTQNGGSPSPAHLRFIHVWVFENGRWQLVAHQSLKLAN